jgi:hypothetical protein
MNTYQKAILDSRKQFLKLTLKQEQELLNIYEEASRSIIEKISSAKKGSLSRRYLEELGKSTKEYKEYLRLNLENTIQKNMIGAAEASTSSQIALLEEIEVPLNVKATFKNMFTNIPEEVVRLIISAQYYSDGLTLSNRLWNITNRNGADIDRIVKQAVIEQKSAGELAKELDGYINPNSRVDTKTRVKGINKSISYQAQRLARTSVGHAFNESTVQSAIRNPLAIGVKWNLSGSHKERLKKFGKTRDICDDWAEANNYGLGVGIYPPNKVPIDHPNGLCFTTVEYGELDDIGDTFNSWINGHSNPELDAWYKKYAS